ncbi:MAG: site-2 protease family protein [Planctomycetia bacterium]|nr:site-2 protease family protein [Planctomycetia bacterium]
MFYEPPLTQYDVNFRILDIPVRIHPFFWVLVLFLGMNVPNQMALLLWFIVVTASILVHELGHALVMRHYGMQPRIVLYSFGGLTIFDRTYHLRWFENILISFAGPAAGFLLLGALTLLCIVTGNPQILGYFPVILGLGGSLAPIGNVTTTQLVLFLIQVNLFWGILNLLPVFPLDGGQICREYCVYRAPQTGLMQSLKVSFITAIMLAVWFFFGGQIFAGILFAWMAISNYQILQQFSQRPW